VTQLLNLLCQRISGRSRMSVRCRLTPLSPRLLELHRRKNVRSLGTNGVEGRRIDAQGIQDSRRHLGGAHCCADRPGFEARMGQQQHDIRVVMGEPAVHRQLRGAAGVSHAGMPKRYTSRARVPSSDWFLME
jgi:hypothetical protein